MSEESVALFDDFLSGARTVPDAPSLFMTMEGNLQLGWEDVRGNAVELEFLPDSFLLYTAADEEERTFAAEKGDRLTEFLSDQCMHAPA